MSASASSTSAVSSHAAAPNNGFNKDGKSPLLNAWHDPLANIKSNQACVKLVDLNCDGDSKLCICDYDKKLRVYKGTNLLVDYAILETPIAMAITYMDSSLVRGLVFLLIYFFYPHLFFRFERSLGFLLLR